MSSIWMGIAPGRTSTRVLAMHGASETILKARLLRELAARTGAALHVGLGRWESDACRELAAFTEDAGERGAWWRPGAWR